MEKKDEIVANTVWRFLEMRGMLSAQHLHTAHGKALFQALKPCRVTDKFQESLYLAVELLKAGVLHGGRYGGRVWSGGPMSGTGASVFTARRLTRAESDKSSMLLVMRTLSIVPVAFKTEAWHGPLSRELLVFNSFVSTLTRSLRCLVEATAANCLLRGDARRGRDDYLEISLSLPFTSEPNTALGIVFKGYFDCVGHLSKDTAAPLGSGQPIDPAVREQALTILERPFAVVRDVRLELQRAWRFWDAVRRRPAELALIDPGHDRRPIARGRLGDRSADRPAVRDRRRVARQAACVMARDPIRRAGGAQSAFHIAASPLPYLPPMYAVSERVRARAADVQIVAGLLRRGLLTAACERRVRRKFLCVAL